MIKLRALEPEDIDFLYQLENEESLWEVSETQLPFAKHLLQDYIQHAHQDIYEAKQYRYVIVFEEGTPMGCVDLYDFSPKHRRAAVGIALLPVYRGKGYAKEALRQGLKVAKEKNIKRALVTCSTENSASRAVILANGGKLEDVRNGTERYWIDVD